MNHRTTIKVMKFKSIPCASGVGMMAVNDGYADCEVELTIDLDRLAQRLGTKAVRNRTGVSEVMAGVVKCRHLRTGRPPNGDPAPPPADAGPAEVLDPGPPAGELPPPPDTGPPPGD